MRDAPPLLRVTGLVRHFPFREMHGLRMTTATVKAVDGVDFSVRAGRTLGIVGESGCGKSTTARLLTRLDEPTGGRIEFRGRDISHVGEPQLRSFRRDVQMIFQDPYGSLNPRHTVGSILRTPLRVHGLHPGREKARVRELLELVGLGPEHANRYPSEFSGGQRQRIGIARALAVEPKLIVADEPVSALDVSIQAQVMNLLATLRAELGLAFVLVAHDLGVVRHFCDEVAVMHLGKVVEHGERRQIYEAPVHPYTQALLSAAPDINVVRGAAPRERIRLVGDVPSPIDPPSGCHFRTRCWKVREVCHRQEPPLVSVESVGSPAPPGSGTHRHACHLPVVRSRVVAQPPPEPVRGDR